MVCTVSSAGNYHILHVCTPYVLRTPYIARHLHARTTLSYLILRIFLIFGRVKLQGVIGVSFLLYLQYYMLCFTEIVTLRFRSATHSCLRDAGFAAPLLLLSRLARDAGGAFVEEWKVTGCSNTPTDEGWSTVHNYGA